MFFHKPSSHGIVRFPVHKVVRAACCSAMALMSACHGLLDVTNPTLVRDSDIANAAGANARRLDVIAQVQAQFSSIAKDVAMFSDEWRDDRRTIAPGDNVSDQVLLDRRDSEAYEQRYSTLGGTSDPHLGNLDLVVTSADIALPAIRAYTPDSLKGDFLAQVFALKAYAILQMAEDICSGFPINEVRNNLPVFSAPYATDSAVAYALSQLDSAAAHVQDSSRVRQFIAVIRGRALLDLGQYAAAAAAVTDVQTTFVYLTEGAPGAIYPPALYCNDPSFCENYVMGDLEGGAGLPFVSAHDPRTYATAVGPSLSDPTITDYLSAKFPNNTTSAVMASGIEARLIEAEAALNSNSSDWFATLNTLRATMFSPAIPAIATQPTARDDQVNLLYSERAFWLYLTGRRLGDMRRLVRNYDRPAEAVFPHGDYALGGNYATGTAIPFIFTVESAQNPHLTSGCTVR